MGREPADQGAVMAHPPHDPGAPPPRPRQFKAGTPPQTPGLPQATIDPHTNGGYAETPTGAIVASGKRVVDVVDDLGRRIKVKFLSARDRMMLAKVLGGELAKNEAYQNYALTAWAVVELDNGSGEDPRIMPMLKVSEIEFLVDRLGDEGLKAVGNAYRDHFADLAKGPDIDTAKN
jgi:hypothetical protein